MKSLFKLLSFASVLLTIVLANSIDASAPKQNECIKQRKSCCARVTHYVYQLVAKAYNLAQSYCYKQKTIYDPLDREIYAGLTYRDLQSGAYEARARARIDATQDALLVILNTQKTEKMK